MEFHVSRIQDTVSESTESLRDIIWLLAPVDGEKRDLHRRFQVLAEILLGNLSVRFEIPEQAADLKWPLPVRRELIFFYREALHNISRHSEATAVLITMDVSAQELVLRISDDGKGMSGQDLKLNAEVAGVIRWILTTAGAKRRRPDWLPPNHQANYTDFTDFRMHQKGLGVIFITSS